VRALVLRGLAARKARAILTMIAVMLGVAMVAGTYVLTDTINSSFDRIFQEGSKGVDVKVTPHKTIESDEGTTPPPFDASLLERVRAAEGVAAAEGGIFDAGSILDEDGEPIQTGGAPNFIASSISARFSPLDYTQGRSPRTADEIALDEFTADKHGFEIGERVGVLGRVEAKRYELVGVAKFGDVASFGGASLAILTLPEAQRVTGKTGKFDEIDVAAAPGTSGAELRDTIRQALPRSVDVRTGEEQAAKDSQDNREAFSFLTTILLVFAGIAVFVGGFIIFNTFSITVSQRKREFGMLRTLGASRRQILAAVFTEALIIGAVASVLGILAGIGYAKGINAIFKAVGIDLPSSGTVLQSRTIIVALLVGVVLTLVAALSPALRATRVSPLEALREGEGQQRKAGRFRRIAGPVLAAIGVALMLFGVLGTDDSDAGLSLVGLGAVALFIGTAMLSPILVPPLASIAGWPMVKLRGLTGQLARENAVRNPGRTAVTSAALMIGLALVTFVSVFAAGINSAIADTIDDSVRGDIVLQHTDGFSNIPPAAGEAVKGIDGVEAVSGWRFTQGEIQGLGGKRSGVTGIETETARQTFEFEWVEGSADTIASLQPTQAVIDAKFGEKNGYEVGETLTVLTPAGKRARYEIVGSVDDQTDFIGDFLVPAATLEKDFGQDQNFLTLIKLREGADVDAVQAEAKRVLDEKFPTVEALNNQELKDKLEEQFSQILGLIYALLSLAVIVSVFGIVNTLILTIHERTRELGLLRAVGMSRRQVRRLVRYESVITALIGGVLGSLLGIVLALVVSRPLADEGFVLVIPVGSLIVFLILAAIAGVLAAIPPARRASRLDVLEALAYE